MGGAIVLIGALLRLSSKWLPRLSARLALLLMLRTERRPRAEARWLDGWTRVRRQTAGGEAVLYRSPAGGLTRRRALLVHGWNGAASDWQAVAQTLVRADWDVTVVDLPGHGAARGRFSSLPRFVRSLREIAQHANGFDLWVAHSGGAAAALSALAVDARAERIVLVSPLARPRLAVAMFLQALGFSANMAEHYFEALERRERMPLQAIDATHTAPRVRARALLIHDEGDRLVPIAESETIAARLCDALVVRTHGLGHRRILGADETLRAVREFVTQA
jgi:pimeloyl-ACP methyl ester carboxylesterase